MNGRPKSFGAMQKAVEYARWECPTKDLKKHYPAHKSMLKVFAKYADQKTGVGAKVSVRMLVEGTGLSERFIQYQLPVLEFQLGLITCTEHRHGGRRGRKGEGIAPVWTINLSNPAFPDQTLTGEVLVEGCKNTDEGCTGY